MIDQTHSGEPLADAEAQKIPGPGPNQPQTQPDWAGFILALLLCGWMISTSFFIYQPAWLVEQFSILQSSSGMPFLYWPVIALVHLAMTGVPAAALAYLYNGPRYRAVFRTLALATVFGLFLLPVRLVPFGGQSLAALLQILGAGAFLLLVSRLPRIGKRLGNTAGRSWPALTLAPILLAGWLIFGALGSPVETLLNLFAGIAFGLAAGWILGRFLFFEVRLATDLDYLVGWMVSGAVLGVMGAAFGFNGSQIHLLLGLPALGGVLMAAALLGRRDTESAPAWRTAGLTAGLVVGGALAFHDPEELILVLNLGSRDQLAWTILANGISALAAVVLGLGLILVRKRLVSPAGAAGPQISVAAAWAGGLALFLFAGQPAFTGDGYFVVLKDQADLGEAAGLVAGAEKKAYVYDTLVAHADENQSGLRRLLDLAQVDYTPYYIVNGLEVRGRPLLAWLLNFHPDVDRVMQSPILRPLPAPPNRVTGSSIVPSDSDWNLRMIKADLVWERLGVTGEGIVVGLMDSGADGRHPQLSSNYRGRDSGDDYNWLDPLNGSMEPVDTGGHGTHTLGTAVGQKVGVAPGADWMACANLPRNLGNPAIYLDCMQFVLAPFPQGGDPFRDGNPALGADVTNNSWGCPELFEGCDALSLQPAVAALRAAGIFFAVSAGNSGPACGSIDTPPATYDEGFSVGAVDSSRELAFFSSRGPVEADGSGRTKPDIVAPGVEVLSAYPGGTYEYNSGTSMAGPHVAGVVALMWSANPDLKGNVAATEEILIETASLYAFAGSGTPTCSPSMSPPTNAAGYGLVDAYAAVQGALDWDPDN